MILGVLLGTLSMALMAFGIVSAKPVIERTPLVGSTIIRVAAGTALLLPVLAASPRRRAILGAFRPSRAWKAILPGSFLGAYLSLLFWMGGFKNTYASVAGILNQTSTIFALILAALFLKEALTRRKVVAVTLALAGVVLVMLPSVLRDVGS